MRGVPPSASPFPYDQPLEDYVKERPYINDTQLDLPATFDNAANQVIALM